MIHVHLYLYTSSLRVLLQMPAAQVLKIAMSGNESYQAVKTSENQRSDRSDLFGEIFFVFFLQHMYIWRLHLELRQADSIGLRLLMGFFFLGQ